jgi:hypothetical protein
MANRINVKIQSLSVEWVGMTKPYKDKETGKTREPSPSVQFKGKNQSGQSETFFAKRHEGFEPKVGEIIDGEFTVSCFNNNLLFDFIQVEKQPSKSMKGMNV